MMKFYFLVLNLFLYSLQRFLTLAQSCESGMNWGDQTSTFFRNSNNTAYKFVTDNDDLLKGQKYALDAYKFRQEFISSCSAIATTASSSSGYVTLFSDTPEFSYSSGCSQGSAGGCIKGALGFAKLCRENASMPSLEFEQCIKEIYDKTIKSYQNEVENSKMTETIATLVGVFGVIAVVILCAGVCIYRMKKGEGSNSKKQETENVESQKEQELTRPKISS